MANPNIKKIIDERGGYRAVSAALTEKLGHAVPKTTVHTWYRKNKIPAWRADLLLSLPKVAA